MISRKNQENWTRKEMEEIVQGIRHLKIPSPCRCAMQGEMAVLSYLEDVFYSWLLVALQVRVHALCQLLMHSSESMCLSFKHKLFK